jgi:ring-1,2-phenylacetyl-CoA epoxidase subunit PaaC
MNADLKQALINKLLAMADDEIILAHRNSEWTGRAPILEEDIAFSNIAQDEICHAVIWYTMLAELSGEDPETYPDALVFFRGASGYRNAQLVELPKGDWAFTIVRQYLFDAAEILRLEELRQSQYQPLAEAANKIRKEEFYHYRHAHAWLQRLGLGTAESHRRMQAALDEIWPYTAQLFEPLPDEALLVEANFVPDPARIQSAWQNLVIPNLEEAGLIVPSEAIPVTVSRNLHTDHLPALLAEMQEVARQVPDAEW